MESEVYLRQGHHTFGLKESECTEKGESGVSENDICECGGTRSDHGPNGRHFFVDVECAHADGHRGMLVPESRNCPGFSLNRHSEPEPVKAEVCECGHEKSMHYRPGFVQGGCSLIDCRCPSYRHEPEESDPNPNEGDVHTVEADDMAEPEAVRADFLSKTPEEEMRSAVEIAKRFVVHDNEGRDRVSKMVDLLIEAEFAK